MNFIPLAKPLIEDKEIAEVVKTIKSGWLTTGPKVFEFEEELSDYLQEDDKLFSVALILAPMLCFYLFWPLA